MLDRTHPSQYFFITPTRPRISTQSYVKLSKVEQLTKDYVGHSLVVTEQLLSFSFYFRDHNEM